MSALPGNLPDARLQSALRKAGDAFAELHDAFDEWKAAQPDVPDGTSPTRPNPSTGPSSRYHSVHVLAWMIEEGLPPSRYAVDAAVHTLVADVGPRLGALLPPSWAEHWAVMATPLFEKVARDNRAMKSPALGREEPGEA